jgi:hypothetical protein
MAVDIDGVNSTISTDKLIPQSGTALQIGESSDVITIPSGATIVNSGTATGFGSAGADTSLSNLSATGDQMVCKAWINFDGTGTVAIRDSFNVSSLTDVTTGRYVVNFTSAMSNTNYSVSSIANRYNTTDDPNRGSSCSTLATGSVNVFSSQYVQGVYADVELNMIQVFGD